MAEQPEKFKAFLADLSGLCAKHGVYLTCNAYDRLQVWDIDEDAKPFDEDIEDRTGPNKFGRQE